MSAMTPEQIAEINEFGEAEAQANYFLCAPPEFTRPTRLEVKRIGSTRVMTIPALDHPLLNKILGLGVGEPATESMLDEAIAVFQKAGCKNYLAQLSPLARPDGIPDWLVARGFKPSSNWAKMVRGSEPAPAIPTDLALEEIGKDQADAYASVVLATFEMPSMLRPLVKGLPGQPGWHHFMAFEGEKPAAAASMFVNGEVGWLGFDGTLKKYRKRGAQGALQAMRIEAGRELGCKWFVTETGEDTPEDPNPSYHNMLRTGFKLAYLRRNYVHRPPAKPLHMNEWGRALFVVAYSLKYGWERLWQRAR